MRVSFVCVRETICSVSNAYKHACADWSSQPILFNCLSPSPPEKQSRFHLYLPHPPPFSAAGRSGIYLSPLLSEHWRVGERWGRGDRAQIIMVGQLPVEKGAGELGGEEDYGGSGSIHQSISNEGKNWSESSRWKSCFAKGCSSSLPVGKVSGLWCFFVQQRPKRGLLPLHQDFIQIFTFVVFSVFSSTSLTQHPTFLRYSTQTGLENNGPVLNPSPLLANHNYQNPAYCILAQLCSSKH